MMPTLIWFGMRGFQVLRFLREGSWVPLQLGTSSVLRFFHLFCVVGGVFVWLPGDSKWAFHPLVGGHDSPLKGSRKLTIPNRSQRIARYVFFFKSHLAHVNGGSQDFKISCWRWQRYHYRCTVLYGIIKHPKHSMHDLFTYTDCVV